MFPLYANKAVHARHEAHLPHTGNHAGTSLPEAIWPLVSILCHRTRRKSSPWRPHSRKVVVDCHPAGRLFSDMSGPALGIVKLGIPLGGIVIPLVLSMVSPPGPPSARPWYSFRCFGAGGLILLLANLRMIQAKMDGTPGAGERAGVRGGRGGAALVQAGTAKDMR